MSLVADPRRRAELCAIPRTACVGAGAGCLTQLPLPQSRPYLSSFTDSAALGSPPNS
jgi:hypothetical protein